MGNEYDDNQTEPLDQIEQGAQEAAGYGINAAKKSIRDHIKKQGGQNKNSHNSNNSDQGAGGGKNNQNNATNQNAQNAEASNQAANTKATQDATKAAQQAQNADKVKEGAEATKAGAEAAKTGSEAAKAGTEAAKAGAEAAKTGAEAGKVASEAGTAASTYGLSLIPDILLGAGKGASSALSDFTTKNGTDAGGIFGSYFKTVFMVFIGIILLLYAFCFSISTNSSSQNENNQEIQYTNLENRTDPSDRNEDYSEKQPEVIDEELDVDHPYRISAQEYKEKTQEALVHAFKDEAMKIIESLNTTVVERLKNFLSSALGLGFEYDEELTKKIFWDNYYPYNLKIDKTKYYSIGDFLKTYGYQGKYFDASKYKEIPADVINNDLNYAEFTTIISQGQDYQTWGGTYQDYIEMFTKPENQKLMFEMTVTGLEDDTPIWYYGWWEEEVNDGTDSDGNPKTKTITHNVGPTRDKDDPEFKKCVPPKGRKYYYLETVVKPFGLRELYKIAGCDEELAEDNEQPGDQDSYNHPGDDAGFDEGVKNYEMLDVTERYDRVYARMGDLGNAGVDPGENYLGPSFMEKRSKLSTIYGETHTIDGKPLTTGRSANYYIKKDLLINAGDLKKIRSGEWEKGEDAIEIDPSLIDGIDDESAKSLVELALSFLNTPYVWAATGPSSFDCSGFTSYVFRQKGISLPRTAADQCRATHNFTSEAQAKPGDLIFFKGTNKDRPATAITHVGIYIGNGQMIHASSGSKKVVITSIHDKYRTEHFACFGRVG